MFTITTLQHDFGPAKQDDVEDTPWQNTPQRRALARMEIRAVLSANLKRLRRARGLSQEELAHRADVDRTYVSSIERQVYAVTIDVLDRLAGALEVEASDLLRRHPDGPRPGADIRRPPKAPITS